MNSIGRFSLPRSKSAIEAEEISSPRHSFSSQSGAGGIVRTLTHSSCDMTRPSKLSMAKLLLWRDFWLVNDSRQNLSIQN
jgi:hypothetical protein